MSTVSAARRHAALSFILVTVVLDTLTFGLSIPVLPDLVKSLSGNDAGAASRWMGLLIAAFAAMQFAFSPLLGVLSDRYGRRPVLLLSILGAALDQLLLVFAPTLAWLVFGRLLAGLTAANFTVANAYVADVSAPEHRAKNFGMISAAFGVGFVVAPALGGYLGEIHMRLPFAVAAGLAGLNFLYGLLVLPESLPRERRGRPDWKRANPLGSLRALRVNRIAFGLAGSMAFLAAAFAILQTVWVLYTAERYGWTSFEIGLSLAALGLGIAIVQGGLMGAIVKRLGDRRAVILGLVLTMIAYMLYAVAPEGRLFYLGVVFQSMGGICGPGILGIVSRSVGADEQGAVQGAFASVHSVVFMGAPFLGAWLFASFTAPGAIWAVPGMPFYIGAAANLLGLILAWRAMRHAAPLAAATA